MDLSKLDLAAAAEKGAVMTLRNPINDEDLLDDNGKPITIRVLGADSREFKRKVEEVRRARARKNKDASLPESERIAAELMASVTVGWDGIVWEGEHLEFTPANAEMLYTKRPWVRNQVDEFVADAANFFNDPSMT